MRIVRNSNSDHVYSKPECHAVSKTFSISKNTVAINTLLKFSVMWSASLIQWSVILWFAQKPNWLAVSKLLSWPGWMVKLTWYWPAVIPGFNSCYDWMSVSQSWCQAPSGVQGQTTGRGCHLAQTQSVAHITYICNFTCQHSTVSCQKSGSSWIPTIYSFTCNSSTYVHTIYTSSVSLGLAQQVMP
jgi:hypothetical protein